MKIILIVIIILLVGGYIYFTYETSVTENEDNYIYELPYSKGRSFKIVQGYGGLFSHQYKAALDFSMPVGTPVHAAREGTVYSFKDDSNEGGPFAKYQRKANYIIIRHDDGSMGCYWHLQLHGVVVKTGRVQKGQLIGYSGNTGFVLRPHLHFAVKLRLNYEKDSFTKTKFLTSEGVVLLKRGRSYRRPI